MRRLYIALVLVLVVFLPVSAAPMIVDASSNIFGAGHSSTPNPGGVFSSDAGYTGTLPPLYSLTAGLNIVQFPTITGTVNCCSDKPAAGPEGGNYFQTDLSPLSGLSGIQGPGNMFLVGVFLSGFEPSGTGPTALNFTNTGIGTNFSSINPLLNQVFFIGDGRKNDGTTIQSFIAPAGATRLYLGFADGVGFVGDPGAYGDNTGALSVSITQPEGAPEPASVMLFLSGALGLFAARKFRKPTQS